MRRRAYGLASFLFLGVGFPVWFNAAEIRGSGSLVVHLLVAVGALKVPPFDKDRAVTVGAASLPARVAEI